MKTESNEADSLGLSFESHDDALDYVEKAMKRAADLMALNNLNLVERYEKGVLELHLVFSAFDAKSGDYHLVFGAVPSGRIGQPHWSTIMSVENFDSISKKWHGPDDAVFIGVTKLVQGPEQVIPSLVWFCRAYDVADFRGEISPNAHHLFVEGRFTLSNGEVFVAPPEGKHGLVKRGSQVVDGVDDVTFKGSGHRFTKSELAQLVSAVRARLNDCVVNVEIADEGVNFAFEVRDVILSPCDAEL